MSDAVLTERNRPFFNDVTFLAAREDGLGARLQALLNAMVLAKNFGGNLRVFWPLLNDNYHAILPKERMFSDDFIRSYFLEEKSINYHELLEQYPRLNEGRLRRGVKNLRVDYHSLSEVIPNFLKFTPDGSVREAFQEIVFSRELEVARAAANAVRLASPTSALHLRAGDIVYGEYRFQMAVYCGKVLAYPLCLKLCENLRSSGKNLIIFGEDKAICSMISKKFGGISAMDISNDLGFNEYQRAIFDFVLMSRCDQIINGGSAFSALSGQIAGLPVTNSLDFIDRRDIRRSLLTLIRRSFPKGVPRFQMAFACAAAVLRYGDLFNHQERNEFLFKATLHDPSNSFYELARISNWLNMGEFYSAKSALNCLVEAEAEHAGRNLRSVLGGRYSRGATCRHVMSSFVSLAGSDHPGALLCLALSSTDAAAASRFSEKFLKVRPKNLRSFDHDVRKLLI